MRLRQICDTPPSLWKIIKEIVGIGEPSRSFRSNQGWRTPGLIFSQFRGMLDILEQEIDQLGMTSFKITGSTPAKDRQEMTNAFNAGERHAFSFL